MSINYDSLQGRDELTLTLLAVLSCIMDGKGSLKNKLLEVYS